MRNIFEIISEVEASYDTVFKLDRLCDSFQHEGMTYNYLISGNCKNVYLSADKKTVMKFADSNPFGLDEYNLQHVLVEADCYEQASEEEKLQLAKSEYIPELNAVRQEYVEVVRYKGDYCEIDCRELGRTEDGRLVVFDYDPMYSSSRGDRGEYYYNRLQKIIDSHLHNCVDYPQSFA